METTLNRHESLHKKITETIMEQIVSGHYGAGVLLPPERDLCEMHGVSRTVIREAVKLLESRRLVRIERGRGTIVEGPNSDPVADSLRLMLRRNRHGIEDLLEIRKILETGIAALAAERRTEANLQAMERNLAVMRAKPSEPEGYVDADLDFHAEIARAAGNPVLLLILQPMAELLRESRIATFRGPRFVLLRTRQHERIFQAIRQQHPEEARTAMLEHLADTQKDLERHDKDLKPKT